MATTIEIVRKDADKIAIGKNSSVNGKTSISIGSNAKSDGTLATAIGANAYAPKSGDDTPSIGFAATEDNIYFKSKNGDEPGKDKYTLKYLFDANLNSAITSAKSYTDSEVTKEKDARETAGYLTSETEFTNWKNDVNTIIGKEASGTGSADGAIAIGTSAISQGNAISIGQSATGWSWNCIVIGASAYGINNAVAIGQNTKAYDGSVVIGTGANVGYFKNGSVAIGHDSTCSDRWSVSVGKDSKSNGSGTVSIGRHSNSSGQGATAIGEDALASGDGSFALGNGAYAGSKDILGMRYEAADIMFASSSSTSGKEAYSLQSLFDKKVDTTRTINTKPLSTDITLTASDVNALSKGDDINLNNDYSLENALYVSTDSIDVTTSITSESIDVSYGANIGGDLTVTGNIESTEGQIDAKTINASQSLYGLDIKFGSNSTSLTSELNSKIQNAKISGSSETLTKENGVLVIPKSSNTEYGVVKTSVATLPTTGFSADTYIDGEKLKAVVPNSFSKLSIGDAITTSICADVTFNDSGYPSKGVIINSNDGVYIATGDLNVIGYGSNGANGNAYIAGKLYTEKEVKSVNGIFKTILFGNDYNINLSNTIESINQTLSASGIWNGYTISETTTASRPDDNYAIKTEDNGIYSVTTTTEFATLYPNGINVLWNITGTGTRAKTFILRVDATACATKIYVSPDNLYTIDFIGKDLSVDGSITGISYITFMLTGTNRWKVTSEQCV